MNLNQQLWSGLTTAALLLASLSTASAGSAEQTPSPDDTFDSNVSLTEETSEPTEPVSTASSLTAVAAPAPAPEDAVKVGEYRSQDQPEAFEETIALIQPHEMQGRSAATLYVRNIPVLTFLGASPAEATAEAPADVKVASTDEPTSEPAVIQTSTSTSSPEATRAPEATSTDPTWHGCRGDHRSLE
jgi:rare lipoprotein A